MKIHISLAAVLVLGFAFAADAATYSAGGGTTATFQATAVDTGATTGGATRTVPPPKPPPPPPSGDPDFDLIRAAPPPPTPQEGRTDALFEIKGVEGDAGKAPTKGAATDRLQNAGPINGTTKGGVKTAVGDITGDGRDDMKGGVSIAVGDINGLTEGEKAAFLALVKAHAQVKSGQDLTNFAKGVLLNDDAIKGVKIDNNVVEVESEEAAKLFGVIPLSCKMVVIADLNANGETDRIKVKFPWWHILATTDVGSSDFKDMIDSALNLTDDGLAAKSGKMDSISIKQGTTGLADMLATISNVLKTRHDTVKNSIGNIR